MRTFAGYVGKNGVLPRLMLVGFLIYVSVGMYFGKDFFVTAATNLIFHEAGHMIFSLFGETIGVLGGTIMQLAVPSVLLWYFVFKQRDYFASGIMLWWLGENMINVGTYIRDANAQVLELLGNGGHDWFFLFNKFDLLSSATTIGDLFWHSGVMLILTGIMWSLMYSHKKSLSKGAFSRLIPTPKQD